MDLSGNINLKYLRIWELPFPGINGSKLTSINLSNNIILQEIFISGTLIDNLNLNSNVNLKKLALNDNYNLDNIDLKNNKELIEFILGSADVGPLVSNLATLDLSMNTKLERLSLGGVGLQDGILDLTNNTSLVFLSLAAWGNRINIGFNPSLETFSTIWSSWSELDLSGCPNLRQFGSANVSFTNLNLKNGNNINMTASIDQVTDDCVQVDDADFANANFTLDDLDAIFSEDCGF